MRILMLGNSYTFTNEMPKLLAKLTGAEVVHHTRGGARLAEHLNTKTKMGARTQKALSEEHWDYVILQEMSNGPVKSKAAFLKNAGLLCEQIKASGAVPVFYATWAYEKGGKKMEAFSMSYEEMHQAMYEAYHEAAEENGALIADVGMRFYEESKTKKIYAADGSHPNEEGSRIAAETIAGVLA